MPVQQRPLTVGGRAEGTYVLDLEYGAAYDHDTMAYAAMPQAAQPRHQNRLPYQRVEPGTPEHVGPWHN